MKRDFAQIVRQPIDVLVIGSGIIGAGVAWDLALRGVKTLLVDKGDFGGATSSGCFKIVHGGLRYLQHFDFARLNESVKEQQALRRIAPHFVEPLPFLIPCYQKFMQRKTVLQLGVSIYERLAWYRNQAVDSDRRLPNHRVFSREETLAIAPGFSEDGLSGGIAYYDCQMTNADRLTFAVVKSAAAAGASVCNYCTAHALAIGTSTTSTIGTQSGVRRIESVELCDQLTGERAAISPKFVVHAGGPWHALLPQLFQGLQPPNVRPRFSKGVQIVVPQLVSQYAFAVESTFNDPAAKIARGARSYFVHPWRGRSLIGTTDSLWEGDPDSFSIDRTEIAELLRDFSQAYRSPLLTEQSVQFAFGGLRPLAPEFETADAPLAAAGAAKAARKDVLIDHAHASSSRASQSMDTPLANLVSVQGVKYTTFRKVAEDVANLVCRKLSHNSKSKTAATKLVGAPKSTVTEYQAQLASRIRSTERVRHLVRNYGTDAEQILELEAGNPALAQPLAEGQTVSLSECLFAARSEMAATLQDVVLRRTPVGSLGSVSTAVLRSASSAVQEELGWTDKQVEEQVDQLERHFSKLRITP